MQRKDSTGVALPCSPPGPVSVLLPLSLSLCLFLSVFLVCVCPCLCVRGEDREEMRKITIEGGRKNVCMYACLKDFAFIHDYV